MKLLFYFLILMCFISNEAKSQIDKIDTSDFLGIKRCKIEKIQSQKDVYIIFARTDDITYKIVSVKDESCKRMEKIKIGEIYELTLYSYFFNSDVYHRYQFLVSPNNLVLADKNKELCYSTNLRGLNYQKEFYLKICDSIPMQYYVVKKIMKKNNISIITVNNGIDDFLIFSIADSSYSSCKQIEKGMSIRLKLYSYYLGWPLHLRFGIVYIPFQDNVNLKVDLRTRNAFYATNLRGLCLDE